MIGDGQHSTYPLSLITYHLFVISGGEEYHRDEEGTSIQVYHTTVSAIIRDDDLGNGDLVRFTIKNLNDGSSASIVRSVLPEE